MCRSSELSLYNKNKIDNLNTISRGLAFGCLIGEEFDCDEEDGC